MVEITYLIKKQPYKILLYTQTKSLKFFNKRPNNLLKTKNRNSNTLIYIDLIKIYAPKKNKPNNQNQHHFICVINRFKTIIVICSFCIKFNRFYQFFTPYNQQVNSKKPKNIMLT